MIKKIFVGLVITIVFGIAVLGVVNNTFAQASTPEVVESDPEVVTPCEPVLMLEQLETNAYLNNECTGDCDDMLQTQTRLQQGPMGGTDGVCPNLVDGECPEEQLQTRQMLRTSVGQGTLTRTNQRLNENAELGTCTGECDELLQTQTQLRIGEGAESFGMRRGGNGGN